MLIIGTHSISIFDWSSNPVLANLLKRAFANSTVYFLFISGFLFQHLSHRYRPGSYYMKKARNVLGPYVIASIPAIVLYTAFTRRLEVPPGLYDHPVWVQVVQFLWTGSHLAPFWYIPALALIFFVSPLLHRWDRHPSLYALLPILFAVPFFVTRGFFNPVQAFAHYLPIFILGMACSRYRDRLHASSGLWFWPLALFAALMFAAELRFAPGTHSGFSYVQKAALALFFLEGFRRWGKGADRWFGLFGSVSFGMYFIHSYIISGAKVLMGAAWGAPPAGGMLAFFPAISMVIGASFVATFVLVRLLGPNSLVLGVPPLPRRAHPVLFVAVPASAPAPASPKAV